MKRTAVLNVVGLTKRLIGQSTPNIDSLRESHDTVPIEPAFPAVTCTAQSNYLTGVGPSEHGIVGNGWYDREYSEFRFWPQSNHLVGARKIWQDLKCIDPAFTCAKLFWWFNMYSSADYSITPRPIYPADGRKEFDIYTTPLSIRDQIKRDLGKFPFRNFWGPSAGIESSRWIAEAAKWIETRHTPTLHLIYLPHLDYNLQRLVPCSDQIQHDLKAIDSVVGDLITFFRRHGVEIVLLSEYGITEVDRPIHINRELRKKGWLCIKDELGLDMLDCGASTAFALADHQIAHVYVNDPTKIHAVQSHLEQIPGVEQVLDRRAQQEAGVAHSRGGDFIAIADSRSWFTYYYWLDDRHAPDFARCVDIHRKAGYDPAELFIDPEICFPRLRVATWLLRKRMGMRGLLRLIPLHGDLVKGSHGRRPEDITDFPVLIVPKQGDEEVSDPIESIEVYDRLKALIV